MGETEGSVAGAGREVKPAGLDADGARPDPDRMPVYAVNKPLGLTSHDVVARARRLLGTRKVGHTGTLDPLATGVLLLCAGSSTKLVQFMEGDGKDYLAWVSLGAATPTLDAEGPVGEQVSVDMPTREQVEAVLPGFLGSQQQVPPQYSALQVNGVRAYAVARSGGSLDLPARSVVIQDLRLLGVFPSLEASPRRLSPAPDGSWRPDPDGRAFELPPALGQFPTVLLWARVGSGTYLRSLARDLGAALGVPAHLAGLVRTRVGKFGLEQTVELEELSTAPGLDDLDALDLPRLELNSGTARALREGKRPASDPTGRYAATLEGQLVAVVDGDGQCLKVVRGWA